MADLAVDDVAEQSPGLAVELHQLHLFKRLPIQARIVHSRLIFYFDQVPQVARACKHRLIPPDETALLLVANYD